MPTVDDELQRRIHRAAPIPSDTAPVEGIYRRKHRRSIVRRASAVGVVVLVLAGALVAFAAVDRPNTLVTPADSTLLWPTTWGCRSRPAACRPCR